MLTIEPTGAVLGATVQGIDVKRSRSTNATSPASCWLSASYGVLRFPDQQLDLGDLRAFSERFGEIQGPSSAHRNNYAHVGTLSNLKEDGKYIGSPTPGRTGTPTCPIAT